MDGLHYLDTALVIDGFYKGQKVLLVEHDKFSDVYYGYLQHGERDQLASFLACELKPIKKAKFAPGPRIIKQVYDTAQILKLDDYR